MRRLGAPAAAVVCGASMLFANASASWSGPTRTDGGGAALDASSTVACAISLHGALERRGACTADQPSERTARDAGGADFAIVDGTGQLYVTVHFKETPAVGPVGAASFIARASVQDGDRKWEALWVPSTRRLGRVTLEFSSVKVSPSGRLSEVHGVLDAELLPTVEGRAAGVVELHAAF